MSDTPETPRQRKPKPPPPPRPWLSELISIDDVSDPLWHTLWRILRAVRMWAETPPDEDRSALFDPVKPETRELFAYAQSTEPELAAPLGIFASFLTSPGLVSVQLLADSCARVQAWAEARGLLLLASHLAELAALVDADDPKRAKNAALMCRRARDTWRANVWYERAHTLAVLAGDDATRIEAMIGNGSLSIEQGEPEEAYEWYRRAARSARRRGKAKLAAEAFHGLLWACSELGKHGEALQHARRAAAYYTQDHPWLPYLVHDVAFELIRRRYYTLSLYMLAELRRVITSPAEQVLFYSTVCWAAGGAGRRDVFDKAERHVLQHIGIHSEHATAAFLHVAEGARFVSEWDKAAEYAAAAARSAQERNESKLFQEAETLAAEIAARTPGTREIEPADDEPYSRLARRLAARLRKWKRPGQ